MKQDRIMKIAAVYCAIFTLIVVTGVGYYMKNRTIVYATGGTLQESDAEFETKKDKVSEVRSKTLEVVAWSKEKTVEIPITESVTENKFVIMNSYAQKSFDIYIDGLPENFFDSQKMQADFSHVNGVTYSYVDGITKLEIGLNSVYECDVTRENSKLILRLYSPSERYDHIVLVDVGHGGEDVGENKHGISEKEATLMLAEALETVNHRKNFKLYFTRLDDLGKSEEEILQLVKLFEADVLLSVHTATAENLSDYGINVFYNEDYYTKQLNTARLSYELAVKVAEHTYNRANGIWGATEEQTLIKNANIPAIELQFGYLSNQKEVELLRDEEYYNRIAKGIMEAFDAVFAEDVSVMENENE